MVAIAVQHEDAAPVAVPVTTEEAEVSTTFHITTDTAANWLLSKLATIDAEIQRVQAQAARIVKQLESDRESLLYLYQGELSAYVQAKIEANGGRRRSIHFLQGTCQFRRVPAHVSLTDLSSALSHAKETGLPTFRRVEKFDTEAYRALAEAKQDADGTLLPGCEMVPEQDKFSIRFATAKAETE